MKSAFPYYGGKSLLAKKIVALFPQHTVYIEPFAGAANVFFEKAVPVSRKASLYREVLNDKNGMLVNFYKMLRKNPDELIRQIEFTLYSKQEYKDATDIVMLNASGDSMEDARAWFVAITQAFNSKINGGWGRTQVHGHTTSVSSFRNRIKNLLPCHERLRDVFIECDDALEVIRKWDTEDALFYLDPPYPGAYQGHYKGYTVADFEALVDTLKTIKGSFLLSCYHQECVPKEWERFEFEMKKATSKANIVLRTEVVWRNLNKKHKDMLVKNTQQSFDM